MTTVLAAMTPAIVPFTIAELITLALIGILKPVSRPPVANRKSR